MVLPVSYCDTKWVICRLGCSRVVNVGTDLSRPPGKVFCATTPFLKMMRAAEVAYQLLDIFLLIETPAILQNDNGRDCSLQQM